MIEFKLPSLGSDMDEGTLLAWHVAPGQAVKKGDVIAVVDTTKAAIDIECWHDGVVDRLVTQVGEKIPVGTVMALLRAAGEAVTEPAVPQGAAPGRQRVTPAGRQRAVELGVDLAGLAGTGEAGAITRGDVEQAATRAPADLTAKPVPAPAPESGSAPAPTMAGRAAEMRKSIAAAMSRSKREIPHYYLSETVPMRRALDWLRNANGERPVTARLLPVALLLKAVALTVRDFPEMNGLFVDGGFRPASAAHIGAAISLRQGGLLAPALHDVGNKPLDELMRELTDLVKRCRAGSLRSSEMSDPTITVTNLGDEGVESVFGVIYPPQVALVGFGRVADRPWVDDGALAATPLLCATLAADHRVSDGHRGAMFLARLRDRLQAPDELQGERRA